MLGSANLMACIPVTDYDRSRAFYEGVLGLRFVTNDGFAMVLESNGVTIRVSRLEKVMPFPFTLLGWKVPDIAAVVSALTGKGVAFERYGFFEQDPLGIWTAPSGDRVAWFKDPDGNLPSVSQHV